MHVSGLIYRWLKNPQCRQLQCLFCHPSYQLHWWLQGSVQGMHSPLQALLSLSPLSSLSSSLTQRPASRHWPRPHRPSHLLLYGMQTHPHDLLSSFPVYTNSVRKFTLCQQLPTFSDVSLTERHLCVSGLQQYWVLWPQELSHSWSAPTHLSSQLLTG